MTLGAQDKRSASEVVQDQLKLERVVREVFIQHAEMTTTSLAQILGPGTNARDLYSVLNHLEASGIIKREPLSGGKWLSQLASLDSSAPKRSDDPRVPHDVIYIDWMGVIPQLIQCWKLRINTMLIGPKASGKTEAIRRVAELTVQPLEYENFSLRAREHHFIGRLDPKPDGTIQFKAGSLLRSMQDGCIWCGDEINAAEPDVLIRLDEAADGRRQLTIEGETIHAQDSWWCVATINPLSHAGTKELPPQVISRFPVRIYFSYPDLDNEMEIVRTHCPQLKGNMISDMHKILEAVQQIRILDLPYVPGVRETVAIGKLMSSGVSTSDAVSWCLVNVYHQYDESVVKKMRELLDSRGLK